MLRELKKKEVFVSYTLDQIERREELLKFYNKVFLPTLKKFDGKVYNIRFIKALREQATSGLMYVHELENDHIRVDLRRYAFNYTDFEAIYLMVKLTNGRIDYKASTEDSLGRNWILNFQQYTDEFRDVIHNYDEYMEIVKKVNDAVHEYQKISYAFRNNIEKRTIV